MSEPLGLSLQETLADQLRRCVQCGFCLPTCATYLATGSEVQSPRGRLLLLGAILGGEDPRDHGHALAALDQCIGCRACQTACPSGVPFTLLDHGRALAHTHRVAAARVLPRPALPGLWLERFDQAGFLRGVGALGRRTRSLARILLGRQWRRRLEGRPWGLGRLGRLLGSLPASPPADRDLVRLLTDLVARHPRPQVASVVPGDRSADAQPGDALPAGGSTTVPDGAACGRMLFFQGCANAGLLEGSSRRLRELLAWSGCDVTIPEGQGCCGALAAHTGRSERQAGCGRRNRLAFAAAAGGRDRGDPPQPDPSAPDLAHPELRVVVEAAGCGMHLKEQGADFPGTVMDAVEVLDRLVLPPFRSVPLTVAFHDPCHLSHGQGLAAEPRRLLGRIPGLLVVEPSEPLVCCGSGGAWGLQHPALSAELGLRKARDLAATGADLILTTNPGCLGQIADGLAVLAPEVPILPLTDLLWYAARPRNPEFK